MRSFKMEKYIYAVLNSNTAIRLFIPKALVEQREGTDGVYTISYQDISAVVCDSEIVDYIRMPKYVLARLLVRHQQVIERIMPEHTVIPMRLGTFAKDEIEIKTILSKGYNLIKEIMGKISDKIEIDVVTTWSDFNSILKDVGEEKEIKEFKEKLLSSRKAITVDNQMKVGVMVKKALDKKRERYADEILNVLKTISQNFKVHELMDDKTVMDIAFLINKEKQKSFEEKIEELNSRFNEKLNFRCVGPLPSYSFYTLEIKKMQFEQINWAKKKLDLDDVANRDEIKKAYQVKVVSLHPDRNPDKPGIEKEFDEVTKAHKIINDYCLAAKQSGQKENFSFKEEEFRKNAILIKLREQ